MPAIKTADKIGKISTSPPFTKGVITTMAISILVLSKMNLTSSRVVSFFHSLIIPQNQTL